ncbi:MAG TPA: glycosyltransferase [Bacteroidales bacterium]|jgi:glycosyltransferase involved in cell wall biosynthesis|nr:glycosyltransferase [Bacteroidales bacterium]HQI44468.1 glycosyltransferase [Bacteroidales bacterium]
MNLSYLITVHNETKTLNNLLERIIDYCQDEDQIIILDDFSDNEETLEILNKFSYMDKVYLYQHALNKNYGAHKNYGAYECCKGDWIFQIDSDELPGETLLLNIKEIIKENPEIEMFCVPRINCFHGLTHEHAKQWGWTLDISPTYNKLRVNWPDYQGRIFKRNGNIKWDRRLHEKLIGFSKFTAIPPLEELALFHDKTIEVQLETNKRYNEWFTEEENRGYKGFI